MFRMGPIKEMNVFKLTENERFVWKEERKGASSLFETLLKDGKRTQAERKFPRAEGYRSHQFKHHQSCPNNDSMRRNVCLLNNSHHDQAIVPLSCRIKHDKDSLCASNASPFISATLLKPVQNLSIIGNRIQSL